MMMILGQFVFKLHTTPYQQKQQNTPQRWANNNRIGNRPAYQYLGPGEDTMTLSGALYPELTGGKSSLKKLHDMARTGKPYIMMDGEGFMQGWWIIDSIQQTDSVFFVDGKPRKIDFTISLKQTDTPHAAGL